MGADALVDILPAIAVKAEDLETSREVVLSKPEEEVVTNSSYFSMGSSIVVNMVYSQKLWFYLATAITFSATIGRVDLCF